MSKPLAFRSVRGYITEHGVEAYVHTEMYGKEMRSAVYYNGKVITYAKDKAVGQAYLQKFIENNFTVAQDEPLKPPAFEMEDGNAAE